MPYVSLSGMRTTKRPGKETSCVRRAPLVPIGFFVTWQTMLWPVRSSCSIRASLAAPLRRPRRRLDAVVGCGPFDLVIVEAEVAPVQHGVLRCPDVDEGGLHAGQHVLDPTEVDVPVDLRRVVGRPRDVVLDERAPFEHGDLSGGRADMDNHEVAPEGPAATVGAAPAAAAPVGAATFGPARPPAIGLRTGSSRSARRDWRQWPWAEQLRPQLPARGRPAPFPPVCPPAAPGSGSGPSPGSALRRRGRRSLGSAGVVSGTGPMSSDCSSSARTALQGRVRPARHEVLAHPALRDRGRPGTGIADLRFRRVGFAGGSSVGGSFAAAGAGGPASRPVSPPPPLRADRLRRHRPPT